VRLLKPRYAPQRHAGADVELRDRFDHGKPRANGALYIMLVRLRIVEIGEHVRLGCESHLHRAHVAEGPCAHWDPL
jgi:hypothetical protein